MSLPRPSSLEMARWVGKHRTEASLGQVSRPSLYAARLAAHPRPAFTEGVRFPRAERVTGSIHLTLSLLDSFYVTGAGAEDRRNCTTIMNHTAVTAHLILSLGMTPNQSQSS
jgi:hypothetical protein